MCICWVDLISHGWSESIFRNLTQVFVWSRVQRKSVLQLAIQASCTTSMYQPKSHFNYSFSVLSISWNIKFICLLGKLRTEFTSLMRKSTSPVLSDMTSFARWSDLKLLSMYQLLFSLDMFKTAFFDNTVGTRNFENELSKNLVNFVSVNYFQIQSFLKYFSNVLHTLQPKEGYFFLNFLSQFNLQGFLII